MLWIHLQRLTIAHPGFYYRTSLFPQGLQGVYATQHCLELQESQKTMSAVNNKKAHCFSTAPPDISPFNLKSYTLF